MIAAAAAAAGWGSSAARGLGDPVYFVLFALVGAILLWATSTPGRSRPPAIRWRRYRRPLPLVFAVLASLCLLGAVLYAPSNYDFLSYRLPRLLHWQHATAWHWIDTPNQRLNSSGAASEWLSFPLLVLSGTDRWMWLPNMLCFALLPAATFVSFRGIGIPARIAWYAMWTVPTAYCYVAQAGGTGNDLPGAAFFLFALAFATRAKKSKDFGWLAASGLAMAFCTGIKATNLPLLAPWLCLFAPAVTAVGAKTRLFAAKAVVAGAAGAICSFIPTAVLNTEFSGSWKSVSEEQRSLEVRSVAAGLAGNALALAFGAMQPPLLPVPGPANAAAGAAIPDAVTKLLARDFPRLKLKFYEMANEEGAGLGLGLGALAALSLFGALPRIAAGKILPAKGWLCIGAAIFAVAAYASVSGSESAARLLSPYYPGLLALPFAAAGAATLARRRWWRNACWLCAVSAMPIPVFTPSRPLLPVPAIARAALGDAALRVEAVYDVYTARGDNLSAVRGKIPGNTRCVGMIATGDDIEVSLWRPFGSGRFVRHVDPAQPLPSDLDALVVSSLALRQRHHLDPKIFRDAVASTPGWQATEICTVTSKVQEGPVDWMIFMRTTAPNRASVEGPPLPANP